MEKILDLENDGLNMVADGQFLYIRCKRSLYKYDFISKCIVAQNVIFRKDGKSRNLAVCEKYVIITDFCDLLVVDKNGLDIVATMRLGTDLSSDLGILRCDNHNAFINIRNGRMAVMDLVTLSVKSYDICEESSWEHCVVGEHIYTGTINGNLIKTDKATMQPLWRTAICKKNIYSIVYDEGLLYTVSQDMTIKAVDIQTLEIVRSVSRAVKGMARIIGIYRDSLVIANSDISLWDKHQLVLQERIKIPTGQYNKGAVLSGSTVIGSDFHNIYKHTL